jgi:hypothetical protein
MRHARPDYDRIQDPAVNDPSLLAPGSSAFGEYEPVFILRAKDVTAPETLRWWASMQPVGSESAKLALKHADDMDAWQVEHGAKYADLPGEAPFPLPDPYPL